MKGQELILVFQNDRVFLTPEKSISIHQIEYLHKDIDSFKPSYWKIRVIGYREAERRLFSEILSYELGIVNFPFNQLTIAKELNDVEVLAFRGLSSEGINKTTIPKSGKSILKKIASEPEHQREERIVTETFSISLEDVQFKNGGISFNRNIKHHNNSAIELYIENPDIKEQYDAIKGYFANALNAKKIHVTATIELVDNQIISVVAKSPEIDKINNSFIEEMKLKSIEEITVRNAKSENANNLLTIKEYFNEFGDEDLANVFYQNEEEFLNDLIKISNTKHYKHLRFLSDKHCHEILKLRLIHKPFSFVFLIESNNKYHFVWETLNTKEATYVWYTDKRPEQIENELKTIEKIIGSIRIQGKTAYINSKGDNFNRIYHDYRETVDGFLIWKSELEQILAQY